MSGTWVDRFETKQRKERRQELMKTISVWLGVAVGLLVLVTGCYGTRNVDAVKQKAPEVWKQAGFDVIGYEGYEGAGFCYFDYGCGDVWYTLKRVPDNGIVYHGYIKRWGDEYHIYSLSAIDAIKPTK